MNVFEVPEYIFHTPSTISISGATSSGKTEWVKQLLKHKDTMFSSPPSRVFYFYGIWQRAFDDMLEVDFVSGLPGDVESFADGKSPVLWIMDDLMNDVVNSKHTEELFTRGSHHLNITVIYINQNIFCQGKSSRNIALNTHYNILFRNPRDVQQISRLDSQIGMRGLLGDSYRDATSVPYGYLVVDLSPHNHTEFKLFTHVFPGEDRVVYTA